VPVFIDARERRVFEAKERREVGEPGGLGVRTAGLGRCARRGENRAVAGTRREAPCDALPEARLGECTADASASACALAIPSPTGRGTGVRRRGGRRHVAALWSTGRGGARDVARSSPSVAV
jgi:hypothetical protein